LTTKHGVTPHAPRLSPCFARFRHGEVNGDAPVFVGLHGDRFDARRPSFKGAFGKVAGSVVGMDAGCMENFRAEVVAKSSETALVKHERCTLFSVDVFRTKMLKEEGGIHAVIEDVRSKSFKEWMAVFFGCWQQDDIGCRPKSHGVFVGDEFGSQAPS
jgi:hypothetical protein